MKNSSGFKKTIFCFLLIMAAQLSADAAEIRLKPHAVCQGAVVTLGDVAEIAQADAARTAQLAGIELLPAPATGGKRILTARMIKELLTLQTGDASQLRLAGAAAVEITTQPQTTTSSASAAVSAERMPRASRDQAIQRIEQALVQYLTTQVDPQGVWEVELDRSGLKLETLAIADQWSVVGGQEPWTGRQRFVISAQSAGRSIQQFVEADITRVPRVVVALRPLQRGERIGPADVTLQVASTNHGGQILRRIEDVVGMEVARPIGIGRPIDQQSLQAPVLVRAKDLVIVVARSGGIQVRTTGRALDNGALGDVVTIETLFEQDGRRRSTKGATYAAQVIGARQVQVYVQGATVPATPLETAGTLPTPPSRLQTIHVINR